MSSGTETRHVSWKPEDDDEAPPAWQMGYDASHGTKFKFSNKIDDSMLMKSIMMKPAPKSYHVPGKKQEEKKAPIKWQLGYDVSHLARFESMKNPMRHAGLYRCHRDITKLTEKKIRSYDRGQRMFKNELKWGAYKVLAKLRRLRDRTENVNNSLKIKYSYFSDDRQLYIPRQKKGHKTQNDTEEPDAHGVRPSASDDTLPSVKEQTGEKTSAVPSRGVMSYETAKPTAPNRVLPVQKLALYKEMMKKVRIN